ncbi:hypothetical protein ABZT43_49560 [Streptomyces sp. NPDC005349]
MGGLEEREASAVERAGIEAEQVGVAAAGRVQEQRLFAVQVVD